MAHQRDSTNPKTKRKFARILAVVLAVVFAVALTITLAVVLSRRNKMHYPGTWVKVFPGPSNFDLVRASAGVDQLQSSGKDGNRLFVSKRGSSFGPPFIEILDYRGSPERDDQGKGGWEKSYDLMAGIDIQAKYISFMAPSFDGKRLAVSDSENVTVYQEEDTGSNNKSWVQVGETLTVDALSSYINSSMVGFFGAHSMSLNETGKQLTIVAAADWGIFTGEWSSTRKHYIVASLEENGGKWKAVSVQKNLNSIHENNDRVVFAGSGNMMAIPRGDERKDDWKEKVDTFHRSTSSNESSSWILVDTLVKPEPSYPNPPNDHPVAVSYDGRVCAVGSANYHVGDKQYGRIDVYQYSPREDSYSRMGQALESSPVVFSLGLIVSFSNDHNRFAAYYTQKDGFPRIRVYQYNKKRSKWYTLGDAIKDLDPHKRPKSLELSGSRLAVAVDCLTQGIVSPCFAVYDLVE